MDGEHTRRARRAAALVGTALACVALAACGSSDTADSGSTASEEVQRGGVIEFSSESNPRGLDPAKWWDDTSWDGVINVFDRLTRIEEGGKLVAELAEEVPEAEDDGKKYTFKLRSGVQFHDGSELTAEDVKFSFERMIDPDTGGEGAAQYQAIPFVGIDAFVDGKADEIAGFKVVDPLTLEVTLTRPDSVFLYYTSLPFASIVPKAAVTELGKKFNTAPIGTGPFTAKNVDLSKNIRLERFADYWDEERAAKVDAVNWTVGTSADLALLRIQKGEQDLQAEPMPTAYLAQMRGDPRVKSQLFIEDTNDLRYLTMSLKHPAMKKLEVRKAIAMAIDKEKLLRAVKGMGTVATGIWAPGLPFHSDDLGFAYDPDEAKKLLAGAGFPNGFDVEIITMNYTPHKEIGEAAQADLRAVGIDASLKQLPLDAYLSAVAKFPPVIASDEFFSPFPHGAYRADGVFTTASIEAGCCNYFNVSDPKLDKLTQDAHLATSNEEMIDLYKQVDREVTDVQALIVPLFYPKTASFVSERLRGFDIAPSPVPVTRYFADYWLAQ